MRMALNAKAKAKALGMMAKALGVPPGGVPALLARLGFAKAAPGLGVKPPPLVKPGAAAKAPKPGKAKGKAPPKG